MDREKQAKELLRNNRRVTDGHHYTVPSPSTYPYQWLWDSCFHAIALSHFEPEAAKKELESLLAKQFPSGMIPHIIFWEKKILKPYYFIWENGETSTITQPPMIAYAAWEIHRKEESKEFLEKIYEPMLRFYQYFTERRDLDDHKLIGIINPDESGEDNSPRFDEPMGVNSDISFLRHIYERNRLVEKNRKQEFNEEACMSQNFWVRDVPFNAILIRNLQALGHIASFLGDSSGEHFAISNADAIGAAMRAHMFEDGVFWSVAGQDHTKLKVATWAHFIPLFADLYTQEEAEFLMEEHFRNDNTFRSQYGIRTVSKEEPSYRSERFWRGPIWLAPQWFMYKGLQAYGLKEDAAFIKRAMEACVQKSGFREYFNPETGEGLGAKDFTWGTLLLDMQEEE